MRVLKDRFLFSLIGAILCAIAAVFFVCTSVWHAAIVLVAGAAMSAVYTFRSAERYRAAMLITENPILNVGVASVRETGAGEPVESSVNVVVSGFGILMDGKPYRFGHAGVNLFATTIDRESITLSFGDAERTCAVRLLHGIADKAEVDGLTERLRYETGVVANVSGW